jgi:hypothetical protein
MKEEEKLTGMKGIKGMESPKQKISNFYPYSVHPLHPCESLRLIPRAVFAPFA